MSNGLALISNYTTVSQNLLGTTVVINNGQWLLVALIYGFLCDRAVILFHQICPASRREQVKESDAGTAE